MSRGDKAVRSLFSWQYRTGEISNMASTKRKAETFSKSSANSSIKKARTNNERLRNNKVLPVALETETDSDPIVESETTEHSGDDDGISWPSDDESAVAEDIITNRRGEDRKDQKSKDSVSQFQRQLPGPLALENGAENGEPATMHQCLLLIITIRLIFQGNTCETESSHTGT